LTSFVDYQKYVGAFAGMKGGSLFFTLPVPVQLANVKFSTLVFDAQMKYNDCPTEDAGRGYVLQLSKYYGLWNAPSDMFRASVTDGEITTPGDRLSGFNGSLHYIGTAN
jgi:hypothetical protein